MLMTSAILALFKLFDFMFFWRLLSFLSKVTRDKFCFPSRTHILFVLILDENVGAVAFFIQKHKINKKDYSSTW